MARVSDKLFSIYVGYFYQIAIVTLHNFQEKTKESGE